MNFILIGAAGFVAPRHMQAIKEIGGNLIAALDPHDSVGVLDSYFPHCRFFTEFERFDRHVQKILMGKTKIDYVVVCSPNYLHDIHCSWGLRIGADVICEKPLVVNEHNLEHVKYMEAETGGKVWTMYQLREHEKAQKAYWKYINTTGNDVEVIYYTPRGDWYQHSWKGRNSASGGVAANIGTHLFDLLVWIFRDVQDVNLLIKHRDYVKGEIILTGAKARFYLSVAADHTPQRLFKINGENYEFSNGFDQLHTKAYESILSGNGVALEEARMRVRIAQALREGRAWTQEDC